MTTTDKLDAKASAQNARTFRDAERDDVIAACRYSARQLAHLLSTRASFFADPVANLVAGYALSELHRIGMTAQIANVLEHARAALAEYAGAEGTPA